MELFTNALLFASHYWRRSFSASFVPVQSSNFARALRLFEHPSPHASSGIHFNQGSKTPGTSPFGVLPPLCATLQELRHVPHWMVYWSHSHLPTVTAVVRSLCSLFWSKALPALRAPPLRMMAVRLEWITTVSFSPSPKHMVPSLTLSPWATTTPISSPSPV